MKYESFTPSEQLVAFLDGELDKNQTSSLFAELAINTDLQEEMKDLVGIRNAFRNAQLTPPDKLKHSILINTGLQKSTFLSQLRAGASIFVALWALLTGKVAITTYALLIIGGIYYFGFNSNNNSVVSDNLNIAANQMQNSNLNYPKVSSIIESEENKIFPDKKQNINSSKIASKVVNRENRTNNFVKVEKTNNSTSNSKDIEQKSEMIKIDYDKTLNLFESSFSKTPLNIQRNYSKSPSLLNSLQYIISPDFLKNLSITFSNFNGFSSPTQKLQNQNNPIVNNVSLGIMYNLTNRFSVGVVTGLENFAMQFDGFEGNVLYRYNQNYNSTWAGISAQYSFEPNAFLFDTEPYIGTILAANELGGIMKLNLGSKYYFTSNLGIYGGLEYGIFLYENEGNLYSTNKIGYSLGLMFGF